MKIINFCAKFTFIECPKILVLGIWHVIVRIYQEIITTWRLIYNHPLKSFLIGLVSLYGAFYNFSIVPYSAYFTQTRTTTTKQRVYAVYVNELCIENDGYIDPLKNKEAYELLKTFNLKRADTFGEGLSLLNLHYKLTDKMFDAILKFEKWNWEQIRRANNTQNCPLDLRVEEKLKNDEKEIIEQFPNSDWDYFLFFLKRY